MKAIDHFLNLISSPSRKEGNNESLRNHILVRDKGKINRCSYDQLYYIESRGEYIRFYTENGNFMTKGSLAKIEKELPAKLFIRVHNSYIISINKITAFTNAFVEINGEKIPVSRKYKDYLRTKLV